MNNDDWVRKLCQVVEEGMWPFKAGEVTVSLYERGFKGLGRTLQFDTETLPQYPFKYTIDDRALVEAYNPEIYVYEQLKDPLFRHFRYRPSLPVEDHILLGED